MRNQESVATSARMRRHVDWGRLPVAVDTQGCQYYFTFGGQLFNEVIARWMGLEAYEAGEIALRTNQRLDLSVLPSDVETLVDTAALALHAPADLTTFQTLLPPEIIQRELADIWIKAAVHQRSIERLKQARQSSVPFDDLAPLWRRRTVELP